MVTKSNKEVVSWTDDVILDESASTTPEIVYTEVVQTNGQIQPKAFQYKVSLPNAQVLLITVIATSGSVARDGIKQQFPDASISMLGVSDHLIQVNDNSVIDV